MLHLNQGFYIDAANGVWAAFGNIGQHSFDREQKHTHYYKVAALRLLGKL